ncbi:MAG: hypothetical protein KA371_07395 [Acidobacteria bacterium]|nr:hypothetical protein [Acidobacteriota bacterium]
MTPCLVPDEFVDLLDGTLAAERRAHVAGCGACRATATEVQGALALAESVEVPEPAALFWPSVNARVRAAIDQAALTGWRAWLRWDVLVPMVGLAALVVALATAVDRGAPDATRSATATTLDGPGGAAALPELADTDDAFAMMADLMGSLPEGGFDALGVRTLPEMGEAAAALSADERRALAALLTAAVDRTPS